MEKNVIEYLVKQDVEIATNKAILDSVGMQTEWLTKNARKLSRKGILAGIVIIAMGVQIVDLNRRLQELEKREVAHHEFEQ